jgi:peptidyl-prolyl cis-trans isomerase C
MGWFGRILRSPAMHFIAVGIALFVAERAWQTSQEHAQADLRSQPIVVSRERTERIREDFSRRHGFAPSQAQMAALVDEEIDEEVLYREALARGLDADDRSVQWWLVKKMRFVAEDPERSNDELYTQALELGLDRDDVVIRRILAQKMRLIAEQAEGDVTPDEDELRAYLDRNQEQWRRPARVSLRHVFLSRDRRGEDVEQDAQRLLARVESLPPEQAGRLGDPFPLGTAHGRRSQEQLTKTFGPDFSSRVFELEGPGWHGPIPSAYGLHLVFIEEQTPSRPAELASVRNQVSRRLAAEKRGVVLEREIERMRTLYEIEFEESADEEGNR